MKDPLYGRKKGPKGKDIWGAAAFMNTVKNAGGPTPYVNDVATIAGRAAAKAVMQEMREDEEARTIKRTPPMRPTSRPSNRLN
nr:hypothetical protein [uncultured Duganella sp.]